jgi:hypothetical protein
VGAGAGVALAAAAGASAAAEAMQQLKLTEMCLSAFSALMQVQPGLAEALSRSGHVRRLAQVCWVGR